MPRRSVAVPPPMVSRSMGDCAASGAASSIRAHKVRVWIGMSPPGSSLSPSKVGNGVRPRADTDHMSGVTGITLLFRAFGRGAKGAKDAKARNASFFTSRPRVLASLRPLGVFLFQGHQPRPLEIPEVLEHRLGSDHAEVMVPRLSRLRGDEPVDIEPAALAVDRAGNLRPHVPVQAWDSRHLAAAGKEFPGTRDRRSVV